MKIEMWYDAVAQEIDVSINDTPVTKNDIYGFLYPVRNYPIQSWLYPNGSWKGLGYQISELARGESVDLIFHGRACDYQDVCKCLSENSMVQTSFVEWDICARYDGLFIKLLSSLKNNDLTMRSLHALLQLPPVSEVSFDVSLDDESWVYHITEDADLDRADDETDVHCCIIHNSFFSSYDKLRDLLALTRSLKVPSDAIFCCFDTEERKADYEYYAQSYKRMGFRFCLEGMDCISHAKAKYGLPASVKLKIETCCEISKALCSAYGQMKDSTQVEYRMFAKNTVSLAPDQKARAENMKLLRDNADKYCHGMECICEYIDILLSVSKENKDEVFHYECIDKLDENINLYLNAISFSEVN